MPKDLLSIHKGIMKEREKAMIEDIKKRTPEIQKEQMIGEFIKSVNGFNLKERSNIAWRVFLGKL